MNKNEIHSTRLQHHHVAAYMFASMLVVGMTLNALGASAETNLLQNPGFE